MPKVPKYERTSKVLHKRPRIHREDNSHPDNTSSLAGRDRPGLVFMPRLLPIPKIRSAPINAQSRVSPVGGFPPDNVKMLIEGVKPILHKRRPFIICHSLSFFSRTNGVNVHGGQFYAVGGNMTIQRTGK